MDEWKLYSPHVSALAKEKGEEIFYADESMTLKGDFPKVCYIYGFAAGIARLMSTSLFQSKFTAKEAYEMVKQIKRV